MDLKDFRVAAYLKSSGKTGTNNSQNKQEDKSLNQDNVNKPVIDSNKIVNAANNEKKSSVPTGQVIHGSGNNNFGAKNIKPAVFQNIDFGKGKTSDFKQESTVKRNIKPFSPEKISTKNNNFQSFTKPAVTGGTAGKKYQPHSFVNSSVDEKVVGSKEKKAQSQRLESATEYLKSGGLLKVPIKESTPGAKDSAYRKVAKFLVLIGEDEAAKVLPHLSESEIEKIIPEIASIRTVSKEEAAVILEEFNGIVKRVKEQGGVVTAREMLVKAYGEKRADEMLKKAMPMEAIAPFSYLKDFDKERIYLLIKDENIGVQSLVLSYLDPKKSAGVINLMTPEEKKDIVLRLAKMEPVSPEVLRRVNQAMHEKSRNQTVEETENIDGRSALAKILKKMDLSAENEILSTLSEEDPDLGHDLRRRLFTLDDVVNSDDKFVQRELRELTEEDIAYLIAGKPDEFKEKILSNISANRRAEVRAQDEILTVKRRSDVDKITNQFLGRLRQAFEDGDLIVNNRNDEEFV